MGADQGGGLTNDAGFREELHSVKVAIIDGEESFAAVVSHG
jgi:hypothetical protein